MCDEVHIYGAAQKKVVVTVIRISHLVLKGISLVSSGALTGCRSLPALI